MDNIVLDLLKRSAAIPSMPQVAVRFLEIIHEPEFDFDEIVKVFRTDPGSTSDILRLANSPLFGVTRQITSLQHALVLLGLKRVRSLVLGRYIVDSIDKKSSAALDTSYYWRRSINTAVLSARLTDVLDPKLREEAFIAGLLSDLGVVIMTEVLKERYQPIVEEYRPGGRVDLACMEQELIGITHAQASALVLENWQLPEVVCEAVRCHPLETAGEDEPLLARIVGTADRVSKYLCENPASIENVADQCRRLMDDLDLSPQVLIQALGDLEQQIKEFATMLRLDVSPSNIYELLAQRISEKILEGSAEPVGLQ